MAWEEIDNITGPPGPAGPNPYPVGSVFLAVVPTNPFVLLGFGTWIHIGKIGGVIHAWRRAS